MFPTILTNILASCGTILMQANSTSFNPIEVPQSSVILSNTPLTRLDSIATTDCITVMSDETWFKTMTFAISKSRVEAQLVTFTSEQNASKVKELAHMTEYNFDIFVTVVSKPTPQEVMSISSVSPVDKNGRALRRDITASYVLIPPYIIDPTPPHPVGLDPSIMRLLAKSIGFNLRFQMVKDFAELIKNVAIGKADMAISQPNFAYFRYAQGLDVSPALTQRSLHFTKRHPVPVDSGGTIVYPFAQQVWLAIIVTILVIGISLTWLNWYYGLKPLFTFEHISISYVPLVSESVPHEWFKEKNHDPHLIIMYIWLLLGFLLSLSYKSNLLANLVKVDFEKSPETFQDLLDAKTELFMTQGTVMTILLRDSPFEVHRQVFNESLLKRGGFFSSAIPSREINDRIQQGFAVGMAPSDGMAPYKHWYVLGKEALSTGFVGYYYANKLPLQHEINQGIFSLEESGIMNKLRDKYEWVLTRNYRIMRRTASDNKPVIIGPSHFTPICILLAFGASLSALVFLAEQFFKTLALFCLPAAVDVIDPDLSRKLAW